MDDDGYGNPEFGPPCPRCKSEMDWVHCDLCEDGYILSDADDFTDSSVAEKCEQCMGSGGTWFCWGCMYTATDAELNEPQELNQREE